MEKVIFKRAALSAAIVAAMLAPGMVLLPTKPAPPMQPPPANSMKKANSTVASSTSSVTVSVSTATPLPRTKKVPVQPEPRHHPGLLNFNSGYAWDVVGIDGAVSVPMTWP